MPKYRVTVPEVWLQPITVVADDPDEARERVAEGLGETVEDDFEFSHTMQEDGEPWKVELEEESDVETGETEEA
jgi:hypothetical protein